MNSKKINSNLVVQILCNTKYCSMGRNGFLPEKNNLSSGKKLPKDKVT